MADVTKRRTGEILRELFRILLENPGGMRARDALARVADSVTLTEYEAGDYDSGGRRFEKIVRFATVDCVKAGWLSKIKGTWRVTEAGQKALLEIPDPESFYREAVRLYHVWKDARDVLLPADEQLLSSDQIEDAAEKRSVTFEEAEEQAWTQIEAYLQTTDPFELQNIVAGLLEAMGYHVTYVSPPGKDGGVDIVGYTDPLGAQGPRIKVQVKRWQSKVDSDGLRSFISTVNVGDIGLYVCLGGFTRDAEQLARAQETRRVTLIDAEKLFELWVDFYADLKEADRQRLPLTPIYFLTPG